MILKMILKSFDFQCDFDFQITTSKMILILNHLYLGDLILILKSSTYDDFAHLWLPQIWLLYMLKICWGETSLYNIKINDGQTMTW